MTLMESQEEEGPFNLISIGLDSTQAQRDFAYCERCSLRTWPICQIGVEIGWGISILIETELFKLRTICHLAKDTRCPNNLHPTLDRPPSLQPYATEMSVFAALSTASLISGTTFFVIEPAVSPDLGAPSVFCHFHTELHTITRAIALST